eukprot:757477-Rhodomonas_salina.4
MVLPGEGVLVDGTSVSRPKVFSVRASPINVAPTFTLLQVAYRPVFCPAPTLVMPLPCFVQYPLSCFASGMPCPVSTQFLT